MSKLKVAVVGTGSICKVHMDSWVKRDDVEVIACADINFEKAKAFAEKWNIPQAFDCVEALLKGSDPDIVDVCTWTAAHVPVSVAAINAGKHVICEKPTADSLAAAKKLRKAVKKNGVVFQLAVPNRYDKRAAQIRAMVDAGEFGEVFFGKTAYTRQRGVPGGWFSCSKYSGGGPLLDIGVHRIDLAWYLMGCPKPVSASASASYRIGDYRTSHEIIESDGAISDNNAWCGEPVADYKFDIEDSVSGFVRFENGATLMFEASWTFNGPNLTMTQIAGDKAGALLKDTFEIFRAEGDKVVVETPETEKGNMFDSEIDHFLECIREGKTPRSDIEDAVTIEAILCGIYESARKGKEIKIKL
ncbi:MAG: Gfo/Idh/MocA family oxidoreductase [Ruminococcaceae bacterium]|nr:Gfo/Idh/MocA family oxidoreductase [Oscillospiraceae bacterium]